MKDRRTFFANERVAHLDFRDQIEGVPFAEAAARQVLVPVADVCAAPHGARDAQLLAGARFEVLETRNGWCFGRVVADGYVGYVLESALGKVSESTHWVTARSSHVYGEPNIKAQDLASLSFGSHIATSGENDAFYTIPSGGFVPTQHVSPLSKRPTDAALVALKFLKTPYLWGGGSSFGIDCSGLVQICLHATGRLCPRDSDQQEAFFTQEISAPAKLKRGDLVFWRGHVAIMLNAHEMIHANAHHMAVAIEPFEDAQKRIGAREFGEITSLKRP